jgi:hypothetical protein
MNVPVAAGGAITIVLLVGLGIFVYPWLLAQRGGKWIVALATALLAALFYVFDACSGLSGGAAAAVAAGLALGPLAAGVIVWRLQRPGKQESR